ncbi:hypothetical protein DM01DRAFT_1375819 [Hesseltinella vesiculosa]|uniref:Uncharacterized protein n=1 Tax=Hesseltinella vesiculosa TaxID=101127 RepID=A0A1X2GDD3_9FUNG|nr:hypothetical protein DM01DRAFT_1375819 [Hesseltinella vesiculosa]
MSIEIESEDLNAIFTWNACCREQSLTPDIYPGRLSKEKRCQAIAQTLANEITLAGLRRFLILLASSVSVDDPTADGASDQDQFTNALYKTTSVPDGEMYAESEGFIEVWNVQEGEFRKDLQYQTEKKIMTMDESPARNQGVTCLTTNAEDTEIASGTYDQLVKLHNLRTGKLLVELAGHTAVVNSLRYVGAGRLLSGSSDGTIKEMPQSDDLRLSLVRHKILSGSSSATRTKRSQ